MNNSNSIKNIHELKEAKLKLLLERVSLEQNIQENWSDLKISLKPKNIFNQWLHKIISEEQIKSNPLFGNSMLAGFISKASARILKKLEETINKWST
jgi:hypothetical protein